MNAPLTHYRLYPKYVPNEEIRFRVSADHTEYDIDYVLGIFKKSKQAN